jgi:hypothetical protein
LAARLHRSIASSIDEAKPEHTDITTLFPTFGPTMYSTGRDFVTDKVDVDTVVVVMVGTGPLTMEHTVEPSLSGIKSSSGTEHAW